MADREFTFDFASGLIDDNLLFVDRETASVWSQLAGQAVSGEMEGTALRAIPAIQATWGFWSSRHPQTRVLSPEGETGHPYWYRDFVPGAPQLPTERTVPRASHDVSTLGLGLVSSEGAFFLPLRRLFEHERLEGEPYEMAIDGKAVTVQHDAEGLTAWVEDESGKLQMSVLAYEKSWLDFHPNSVVLGRED